jgi:hypothetical protein
MRCSRSVCAADGLASALDVLDDADEFEDAVDGEDASLSLLQPARAAPANTAVTAKPAADVRALFIFFLRLSESYVYTGADSARSYRKVLPHTPNCGSVCQPHS